MTNVSSGYDCSKCPALKESLFCNLDDSALAKISSQKTCNTYKKGQIVFHEGNRPLGLYCLRSGKVKIFKTGIDRREQIVRLATPGDIIGYRSFLGEDSYTATAASLDDSLICFIDKDDFYGVLKEDSRLSLNIIKLLTTQLRTAEELLRDMAQKSVRERLAEVLLLLRNKFGTDKADSGVLNAKLSREELASFVGTATETLIRLLSDFKAEQVIETRGKHIKILDPKALMRIANLQN
ncbi:MAG: Crp/Fnr family transcriptional regulator [Deltaproteobacteria bacterium]|nr:Crp/Fnr family transcriptional regulator [Deltaproteobacteria bacterium]